MAACFWHQNFLSATEVVALVAPALCVHHALTCTPSSTLQEEAMEQLQNLIEADYEVGLRFQDYGLGI